jgi:hypothetical protein
MSRLLSKPARRFGVIANYAGAILFATIFCFGEYTHWNVPLALVAILAVFALVTSSYLTLIRTGLWRLTHTSVEKLDEREIQVTHTSLRHSYVIFTGFSLALIAFMVLSVRFSFITLTHRGHYSFGLVVLILLQFLIHTLPASIIAWTEKEVILR